MEHAKERAMIYTSAGEKTLKIKKINLFHASRNFRMEEA